MRQFHTADLGAIAIQKLVERTEIDPKEIDAVYFGTANGDARCSNPGRYASLKAGLPYDVSAVGVEMQCGSAIAALNHAAYRIMANDADCIVVGGAESFSQRFFKFSTSQEPYKMIPPTAFPSNLAPAPEDNIIMIEVADLMAKKWGITREECDVYALRSQMLTKQAMESGFLNNQVIPVVIPATKKTPEIIVDRDEHPRPQTTADALAKLRAINEGGVTTAGNASGRNDGGAIAFGHPNGASGGRIALSAIRHMENTQGQFGLISSCCGGGIGVSALFERI